MMQLKTSDHQPLYRQLTDLLRRDIKNGVYQDGSKIPTEIELGQIYGVSRITVRNALEELTKENLLIRKRGKGTFVASKKLERDITRASSFTELCEASGLRPGAKVTRLAIEDATPLDIEELRLEAGAKVVVVERVRFADDVPVALEIDRFPESYSFLLTEELNNRSILKIVAERRGISFVNTHRTIELVFATYAIAKFLDVPDGYPLISISSTGAEAATGIPGQRSLQLVVGDKFKLVI